MNSKDATQVLREVRRMRDQIRDLPPGDVRRMLTSAADRLEMIAHRLETDAAPKKPTE